MSDNEAQPTSSPLSSDASQPARYYLMKAEPDTRMEKGKDVKFSVDDFEEAKTTAWEGVRNYSARNTMQGMKVNEKVLFYHSNTKVPGIAGFAEVCREAYPDHTAWDKDHPYYDAKSDSSSPRWFMVDLRFIERAPHFVSLVLLKQLAGLSDPPSELSYLTADDLKAIKGMELLSKSRLSVQKVEAAAWEAVNKIARNGYAGFQVGKAKATKTKGRAKTKGDEDEEEDERPNDDATAEGGSKTKRKASADTKADDGERRRSKRVKK
ncbi:hypothetical protein M422DRAFT_23239 [Sphaerobolus stellatus SS14]|nr:hypothetical protein M422DRAFT_23239 [Sphaerobolus stellatus SS14]